MTRHRERRSFTVAAKSSGHQGFVSIPAKAPRIPHNPARASSSPAAWDAVIADAPAVEPAQRRILPNLVAWELPAQQPEPADAPEPPLPRVRRVTPQGVVEDAPRRRGRPRKHPLPVEMARPAVAAPEPAPATAAPRVEPIATVQSAQRRLRPDGGELRLGERWKRRLPRSCW